MVFQIRQQSTLNADSRHKNLTSLIHLKGLGSAMDVFASQQSHCLLWVTSNGLCDQTLQPKPANLKSPFLVWILWKYIEIYIENMN